MSNEVINNKHQNVFDNKETFETAQRMAKGLSASSLIPSDYQKNVSNTLIALEIASRTGTSPVQVMQHLYVIHGRPSWSSQFIIAGINKCGRFKPLQFTIIRDNEEKTLTYSGRTVTFKDMSCIAHTTDYEGIKYESPAVSIEMARLEGWYDKTNSKWKTMSELMLRYRAASFFGRLYVPDILMGMYTEDEARDMAPIKDVTPNINNVDLAKRFDSTDSELTNPKEQLQAEAEEMISLIENGKDKVTTIQEFGGDEFMGKLNVAGLVEYEQLIKEV